jgi:hypothetical protein
MRNPSIHPSKVKKPDLIFSFVFAVYLPGQNWVLGCFHAFKQNKGVCHTVALPSTLIKYLKEKEEL